MQNEASDFVENNFINTSTKCWFFQCKNVLPAPLHRNWSPESQGNKKLCFCPSSLALDERLVGQNLLFQHCMIKVYLLSIYPHDGLTLSPRPITCTWEVRELSAPGATRFSVPGATSSASTSPSTPGQITNK